MQATGRGNVNRRVGRAPAEGVLPIWIKGEDDRISVDAGFKAKLKAMASPDISQALTKLKHIAISSRYLPTGHIEGFEKAVGKSQGRLSVVHGRKEWRSSKKAEVCLPDEPWGKSSSVG